MDWVTRRVRVRGIRIVHSSVHQPFSGIRYPRLNPDRLGKFLECSRNEVEMSLYAISTISSKLAQAVDLVLVLDIELKVSIHRNTSIELRDIIQYEYLVEISTFSQ